MMTRRRTWPEFSPCNTTNCEAHSTIHSPPSTKTFKFTSSEVKIGDSYGSCPPWMSMNSLLAILPDSPSPICSSSSSTCTPKSLSPSDDIFYSQVSAEIISTPTKQSCYTLSNISKPSPSNIAMDGWIESANHLRCSDDPNLQHKEDEGIDCLSISTEFESANQSMILATIDGRKSNVGCRDQSRDKDEEGYKAESPMNVHGRHKLMSRPKPYHEFLDEIKRQEIEAQINAWRNATHMKYMDRLRRKEAAISEWECKQTRKAVNEMKKLESKLEKKHTKALEKMQGKISEVEKKAAEKKASERSSMVDKITKITKESEQQRPAKNLISHKLRCLC